MKKIFLLLFTAFLLSQHIFASSGSSIPPKGTIPQDTGSQQTTKPLKGLVILGDYYAVDEASVYVVNDTRSAWVKIPADRASFRVILGQFARDNDEVFLKGKSLPGVDIKSFSVISGQYGYAQDDNHIYSPQGIIAEADPETFKMLTKNYSLDAGHVFFQGKSISQADSGSFKVLESGLYAIDDKSVFYAGKLLKGVSPHGFSVKGARAFADDGRIFFEGLVDRGDLPHDDTPGDTPVDGEDPSDIIQAPTENAQAPTDISAEKNFLEKILQYKNHFIGNHQSFWILAGIGGILLFSVLFALYAERNDEPVSVWKSIMKLCITGIIIGVVTWIFSLFLALKIALIIGCIVGGIVFIFLWSVLGIIKSILISLVTFVTSVFFIAVGFIGLRLIFGNIENVLTFLNQSQSELMGTLGIVGFFFGSWLIVSQLKSRLFPALVQSFVATILSLFILGLFLGILGMHTWAVILVFSLFYAILLWMMRFRNASNIFTETVRIVRVDIVLFVVLLVVSFLL